MLAEIAEPNETPAAPPPPILTEAEIAPVTAMIPDVLSALRETASALSTVLFSM